jgi:hypothetical protein
MFELTGELGEAVAFSGGNPVSAGIPLLNLECVVLDAEIYNEIVRTLKESGGESFEQIQRRVIHDREVAAIQAGLDDLEAGRGQPLDEAMDDIRHRLIEEYGGS